MTVIRLAGRADRLKSPAKYPAALLCAAVAFAVLATDRAGGQASLPETAGEETLQALYDLERFAAVHDADFSAHYWFSSYTGDDASPGDALHPLRSLEKSKHVCVSGTRCTFFAGDVWSESLITAYTLANGTLDDPPHAPVAGDLVAYDAASDTSVKTVDVGDATSGQLCFTYDGVDTAALSLDRSGDPPSAQDVEANLEAHPEIVDVEVGGGGETYAPWIIKFVDPKVDLAAFGVNGACGTGLVGGTPNLTEAVATARIHYIDDSVIALTDLTGRHQLADDDDLTSVSTGAIIDITTVTNTLSPGGAALDPWAPSCDDDEKLCILIEGESTANRPIIDCGGWNPDDEGSAIMGASGYGSGWVGVQNFIVQDCASDVMSQQNSSNIAYLNIEGRKIRNRDEGEESNNCITTHNDGNLVAINSVCSGIPDSDGNNGRPIALTSYWEGNPSRATIVGQGIIEADMSTSTNGGQDSVTVATVQEASATIVGHTITGTHNALPEAQSALTYGGLGHHDTTLNLCRVVLANSGDGATGILVHATAGATITLNMWETAFTGAHGIAMRSVDTDGLVTITGRGALMRDLSGLVLWDHEPASGDVAIDLEGVMDSGALFQYDGGEPATLATVEAESGGVWQLAATPPNCDGSACAVIGPYTCPLAEPIPAFVLGRTISELALDGTAASRADCSGECASGVIVDDADGVPAATATGTWKTSTGTDPWAGGHSHRRGAGGSFQFEASIEGPHEVSQWWTGRWGRCGAVPVDVFDGADLLETVVVNQKANTGQWNVLGRYDFDGTARVVVNSQDGCSASADAVRFERTLCTGPDLLVAGVDYSPSHPKPGEEFAVAVTVENRGCQTARSFSVGWFGDLDSAPTPGEPADRRVWGTALASGGTQTLYGTWSYDEEGTYASYAAVDLASQIEVNEANDLLGPVPIAVSSSPTLPRAEVIVDDADGSPHATAVGTWKPSRGADPHDGGSSYSTEAGGRFEFEAAIDGPYEVSQWWTNAWGRCDAVPVEIFAGSDLLGTVVVSHRSNAGQWNALGRYDFEGGARVVVNSLGGCSTSADAVRFSPVP